MTKNPYEILKKPIISEKSLGVKEQGRTLCFRVDSGATKADIRAAVQTVFKVKVEAVHTAIFQGKIRRRGRTHGPRPDWKKAYVKLRSGEKMPEFAESA